MPRKPKTPPADLPAIPQELLEQFGNGPMTAEAIRRLTGLQEGGIERALGGEMNHHLGYASGGAKPASITNQRDRDGSLQLQLRTHNALMFTSFRRANETNS